MFDAAVAPIHSRNFNEAHALRPSDGVVYDKMILNIAE